jgi:hypothetical protein
LGGGLVESFAILQKSKGSKAERKLKKERHPAEFRDA